ncbi:MAG: cytochrome b [Thalassobaculales bacterium]
MPLRYDPAVIALHWLTVLLVAAAAGLGLAMVPMEPSVEKLQWYSWHKWVGTTVFGLTLLRLAWRWLVPAPPPLALPAWQRLAAAATHHLLYLLLLALPLTGWVMTSAYGFPVVYLGLWQIPDLVAPDNALGDRFAAIHRWLGYLMALLLALHAGAALKHHLMDRDATLARMVPGLRPRS